LNFNKEEGREGNYLQQNLTMSLDYTLEKKWREIALLSCEGHQLYLFEKCIGGIAQFFSVW